MPISTERNRTPLFRPKGFIEYQIQIQTSIICLISRKIRSSGIDYNGPTPELQTQNHAVIPDVDLTLSDAEIEYLISNFDSLENDRVHGIQVVVYFSSLIV